MFFIANITDKTNAPKIRRQLKKAGFAYISCERQWVKNSMTLRGARLDLPKVKAIDGITFQMQTPAERHAFIEAQVAEKVAA